MFVSAKGKCRARGWVVEKEEILPVVFGTVTKGSSLGRRG